MNLVLLPAKDGSCEMVEFDQEWLMIACSIVRVARGEVGILYDGLDQFVRRTYCLPAGSFGRDTGQLLLIRLRSALEYCGIDGKYALEVREAADSHVAFAFGMQEGQSTAVFLGREPYFQLASESGALQRYSPREVALPRPIDTEPPPDTGNPFQSAGRRPGRAVAMPPERPASQNPFLARQTGAQSAAASPYVAPPLPSLGRSLSSNPFDDVNLQPRGAGYNSSGSPFLRNAAATQRRQWQQQQESEPPPPIVQLPDEPDTMLIKRLTTTPTNAAKRAIY
jgi:hypothetical protein